MNNKDSNIACDLAKMATDRLTEDVMMKIDLANTLSPAAGVVFGLAWAITVREVSLFVAQSALRAANTHEPTIEQVSAFLDAAIDEFREGKNELALGDLMRKVGIG